MSNGKGSKPRPVNKKEYDKNYERIFKMSRAEKLKLLEEINKELDIKKLNK